MDLSEYQLRTRMWMQRLPNETMRWDDVEERTIRFVEEAVELAQALGLSRERVQKVTDYVYGREVGVPEQEVGGVSVTLAVLCNSAGISWETAAHRELNRVNTPLVMQKIMDRQMEKREAGMTSRP